MCSQQFVDPVVVQKRGEQDGKALRIANATSSRNGAYWWVTHGSKKSRSLRIARAYSHLCLQETCLADLFTRRRIRRTTINTIVSQTTYVATVATPTTGRPWVSPPIRSRQSPRPLPRCRYRAHRRGGPLARGL